MSEPKRDSFNEEFEKERATFRRYRGRRYKACRAISDICEAIDNLGVNEPDHPYVEDQELPPPPTEAQKREMKNQAANLLRTILLWNDGRVSPSELSRF